MGFDKQPSITYGNLFDRIFESSVVSAWKSVSSSGNGSRESLVSLEEPEERPEMSWKLVEKSCKLCRKCRRVLEKSSSEFHSICEDEHKYQIFSSHRMESFPAKAPVALVKDWKEGCYLCGRLRASWGISCCQCGGLTRMISCGCVYRLHWYVLAITSRYGSIRWHASTCPPLFSTTTSRFGPADVSLQRWNAL